MLVWLSPVLKLDTARQVMAKCDKEVVLVLSQGNEWVQIDIKFGAPRSNIL